MKGSSKERTLVEEGKVFFDSNILIYSVDERDSLKQKIAIDLINKAMQNKIGAISTQSLQEFFSVTTKKLNVSKEVAKEYLDFFVDNFPVTQVTLSNIYKAIDISIQTQFSFWDSLIVSAAHSSGCVIVYSEDMHHNQLVNGVKIINPFIN
ncbi:MAG: PIN domain-containing protein [Treponema sp.]|nr:PIN domain-containing protein [Treponema sp.]